MSFNGKILAAVCDLREATPEDLDAILSSVTAGLVPRYVGSGIAAAQALTGDVRPINVNERDVIEYLIRAGFEHDWNGAAFWRFTMKVGTHQIKIDKHGNVFLGCKQMYPQPRTLSGLTYRIIEILDAQIKDGE